MIKNFFKSSLFTVTLLSSPLFAYNPQPYTNIHVLPYIPYYLEDGYYLTNTLSTVPANVFVDAGSVGGVAARFAAQYGSAELSIFAVNSFTSNDPSQHNLFHKFLSNVLHENTAAQITPIRMSSLEAAKALTLTADVVFVESSSPTLQSEILAWSSHLSPVGVICGLGWLDPNVQATVTQAAATLGSLVTSNDDYWTIVKE